MKFTKRAINTGDGAGGADFLKVPPGGSAVGVFRGECLEFYQAWPQGGAKQMFSVPTPGASSRFRLNFVTNEGGKAVAKIFEFPVTVYNQFAELSENIDLETTKIKISRIGEGKKTQWMLIPLGPLDSKGLAAVEAVPLKSLGIGAAQPAEVGADEKEPF